MSKKEKLPFKVIPNGLQPAGSWVNDRLREKKYRLGDIVFAELTKPRNPQFHRLVHHIGTMVIENIEGFENLTAHQAIKRLQWESGAGCEEIGALIPNVGMTQIRIPLSISFDRMGQEEFEKVIKIICDFIAINYWPSLTSEQVEEMAETMVYE